MRFRPLVSLICGIQVTRLVEMESSLRVCEQIGDNNNDEEHDEELVGETDVLLEVEEETDWLAVSPQDG